MKGARDLGPAPWPSAAAAYGGFAFGRFLPK
jgi:hypothetical protein